MWDTRYQPLLKYAYREGDFRVHRGYSEDGILLETWVVNQRRRKHQWSPERMALLEDVPGWVWETGHEPVTRWDGKFEVLLKYVDRRKHVAVPGSTLNMRCIWVSGLERDARTIETENCPQNEV
jgi:hypothetical protein